ncbi:glycoside hydrolase family 16 protein [Heliocybe sulcata]|uniref:Glycoside hydrolase family 16 protein n=1 Tax=Heliocybe sulcata TaxID=5364 RepID=A0A5C3MSU8_9AGAM|nr:glycoside hydrolase family 16 protein [Heliocybe sulcata]
MQHFSTALSFVFLLQGVMAGHPQINHVRHRGSRQPSSQLHPRAGTTFKLQDMYQGQSFFDGWDFFTGADPTHGNVDFVGKSEAMSSGMAYVQSDNTTVIAVDDKSTVAVGGNRKSVRIQSKKTYTKGLFIADFWSMPHGCGVWPAWWSVGPDWPAGGEIDVVEGVNLGQLNQMTLHTSDDCTLNTNTAFSGHTLGTQCASSGNDNAGCGIQDTNDNSYGHGFNQIAGGVFAHLWDDSGISVWHFARGSVPGDIAAQNPDPSSWGTPSASWATSSCNVGSHFYDHSLVIDTTICGDWAGAAYAASGCPKTCADAVADNSNFAHAKWNVNYIAVYQ